jgi:phosphatidylinositol alpha 1,6-mannosyltransferase
MASGVPVVASAVGGIPDVVEHGRSGLLVPPADPRALRDAVRSQLADDALYARLAAGGRRRVEDRFDATSAAAGMERVYGLALAA